MQLYDIKYSYQRLFKTDLFDLPGTTTPFQSGPKNNDNEGVLYTPSISRTRDSPWDTV